MFKYNTGETILIGDIVRVVLDKYRYGVVEQVMLPHTQEAKEGCCFESGGILVRLYIDDSFTYMVEGMPESEAKFLFRASEDLESKQE